MFKPEIRIEHGRAPIDNTSRLQMSRHGANWYPREQAAYLGGVIGLPARLHAVYSVTLDLIYEYGGSCPHDPKWISGWFSDLGPAAVRNAISDLIELGKLRVEGGCLTNKRAKNQAKTQEKLRENRRQTGKKGGVSSGFSRRSTKENKDLNEASASYAPARAEQSREDKKDKEASQAARECAREAGLDEKILTILGLGQPVPMTSVWADLPEAIERWKTEFGLDDTEILTIARTVMARPKAKPESPAYFDGAMHDHAMRKVGIKVPFKKAMP